MAAPPASPQQEALETVHDDAPLSADAGLDAIISEISKWSNQGQFPQAGLPAIAATPATFRGQTFHLSTGPATRIATSAFDIKHLSAWQTSSLTITEPILLLIFEPDGTAAPGDHVESINLPACFYKTAMASMHAAGALVGTQRDQPAHPPQRILVFVGARPEFTAAATGNALAWGNLVAALLVGAVLLLIVRRYALRRASREPLVVAGEEPHETWNDANLPNEPAEALAELRRRSKDTITHD